MSARRERKVVTVLFADLVGFTSRAETMDPEDVEAILRPYHERLRAELERYGGTVEKFIGDAVMAVFGAPVAHEDDPERAVRAAIEIRDAIVQDGQLAVRIGVNTGEALVNLDARPEAGEGMVSGDVVNTAARLQTAAPENGILVGQPTYRATQRAIDYLEADAVEAKGKADPVTVWEVVQARSRIEVDVQRPRAALVGRQREVEVLVGALARVREERSPQLVTLVGEPGIGKSRLVYELFRAIEEDPELIWWRHGRSLPYGEGVSFWALGEMVKTHAGILETDLPEAVEAKLRAALAGMDDAEWLAGHLRALVGLGGDAEIGADRSAEAFAAWRRFFEELAEQRPLVLVFEDLHWADDGLLDFVDHLVDWTSGVPILVVGSARPELLDRRPGWGGGKRNSTTLSLSPLSQDETARLIGQLLERSVLVAETQQELLARAGGNPLYAEEFVRMLGDRNAAEHVPETVQGVIAARLDGLAAAEKALLQQAAVVGKVFWLGALESMDGVRRDLEELLHGLERKEFVRRERRSSVESDTEYAFLHVLVRDVAYGQIPRTDRADTHERAAAWIESLGRSEDAAEMLAHHYSQALEYARAAGRDTTAIEERARRAFADAGDRAFALYSYAAAMRYYAHALELWPVEDRERSRLLVQQAYAQFSIGGAGDIDLLERSHAELERLGDKAAAAEVAGMIAWAAWRSGDRDRAVRTLRGAVAEIQDEPMSSGKVFVLTEFARLSALGGDPDAIAHATHALAATRELGSRELEARALNTLGVARNNSGDLEGLDDIERSLILAQDAGAPLEVTRAYINIASITFLQGEIERSFAARAAGMEAAERWGITAPARWFKGEQPELDYHAGRWDDALEKADEFIAEVESGSPHYLESPVRSVRSLLRVARGDITGALADDVRQVELARDIGDPQVVQSSLAASMFVRVEGGDRDEAHKRFADLLDLWRDDPRAAIFNPSAPAFAAVALGRAEEFLAVAEAALPTRWFEAACAFAREEYARAAELFREIGSLPNEAYSRLTVGEPAELQRALDFYRSVGAVHHVRQAEAQLAASA